MSVIYYTTLKNTRMVAVAQAIDQGSPSPGYMQIADNVSFSGVHMLVQIPFADPCGTVAGGVLTFSGTPLSANASNTGTAAQAEVFDSVGTVIISGLTVGTSGSDINLSSTSIVSGQSVTITTASITHG